MSWGKFRLLLDKNLTIQKRHPIGGLFEILFPIILAILLAHVRDEIDPKTDPELRFKEFQPKTVENCS